jgi:chorismate mutase
MSKAGYVLVDAGILPEVYRKVLTAKKYLATGKAASVKEAAQLAGISRSAYYKYKDAIFEYGTSASDEVATVKARLQDSAGVLSGFIGAISRVGGNVLSVNQSLPQDGADVTVTVRIADLSVEPARLPALLEQLDGVVGAAFIQ